VFVIGRWPGRAAIYFLIDPAEDAKSLTLFLLSPIGAESDKLGKTEGDSWTLARRTEPSR
jgi:hypothetical protein